MLPSFCSAYEEYLVTSRETQGGTQYLFVFENMYGASVIRNLMSYGADRGLWELAVTENVVPTGDMKDWTLCYDSGITDDVLGYLDDTQVEKVLASIKALEPK